MKRIILTIVLVTGLAGVAGAVSGADAADVMSKGKAHNVAWDTVALEDGTPCADCSYFTFIRNIKTGAEIKVGETTGLTTTIVLPAEGRYRAGVQAYRSVPPEMPGEEAIVSTSTISWSDVPEACANGATFWFRWFQNPMGPKGLKEQQ